MMRDAVLPGLAVTVLVFCAWRLPDAASVLAPLFPSTRPVIYPLASFLSLLATQTALVAVAVSGSTAVGVLLAVATTRPAGRPFRPLASALATVGQTVPPVVVLALAVPLLGYGARPAVLALFLYGLLPVLASSLAGLEQVGAGVLEAGRAMGLSPARLLLSVELPLAAPLMLAGIRTATTIAIGTAAIASTVGVPTLGSPILDGLDAGRPGYVVEGAALAALLALATDLCFARLARHLPAA